MQTGNFERVTNALAAITNLGIPVAPPTDFDRSYGYVTIKGPRTGYHYRISVEEFETIEDVTDWVDHREQCLHDYGFDATPNDWFYFTDRDDDGDMYQYEHFAKNRVTGQTIRLDINYSTSSIDADHFRLMVLMDFPTRTELNLMSGVKKPDLENILFNPKDDDYAQTSECH